MSERNVQYYYRYQTKNSFFDKMSLESKLRERLSMFKGLHHVGVVYKDFSKIVERIKDLYGMPDVNMVESMVETNIYIAELTEPCSI